LAQVISDSSRIHPELAMDSSRRATRLHARGPAIHSTASDQSLAAQQSSYYRTQTAANLEQPGLLIG